MNKVLYPQVMFLRVLKKELRAEGKATIEIRSDVAAKLLKTPLTEYVQSRGWSFLTTVKFLWYLRLLYSLLVAETQDYSVTFDGDRTITLSRR